MEDDLEYESPTQNKSFCLESMQRWITKPSEPTEKKGVIGWLLGSMQQPHRKHITHTVHLPITAKLVVLFPPTLT